MMRVRGPQPERSDDSFVPTERRTEMRVSRDCLPIFRTSVSSRRARLRLGALLLSAAVAALAAAPPAAQAETFNVPCGVAALSAAITAANANGEEDLVWLAPSCVYALTATLVVEYDADSPLRIYGRGATLSGSHQRRPLLVNGGATVHLNELTVSDGNAVGEGGGIQNQGTLTLTYGRVSASSSGGYGGGIYNSGSLRLESSTVSGNQAVAGGGGIDNDGTGRVTLNGSTLSGNSGYYGGGLRNEFSAALFNSTVMGNSGALGGDFLNESSGTGALRNVTISVADGGASGPGGLFNSGILALANSIIAHSGSGGSDCWNEGTLTASGGNLVEDASCGIAGALSGDPKLGAPVGEPASLPLLAGSPALDSGVNAGCTGVDQRGVQRPRDGNKDGSKLCDLGAYEVRTKSACGLLGIEAVLLLPLVARIARARKR
jgi:hypothetical protein